VRIRMARGTSGLKRTTFDTRMKKMGIGLAKVSFKVWSRNATLCGKCLPPRPCESSECRKDPVVTSSFNRANRKCLLAIRDAKFGRQPTRSRTVVNENPAPSREP